MLFLARGALGGLEQLFPANTVVSNTTTSLPMLTHAPNILPHQQLTALLPDWLH